MVAVAYFRMFNLSITRRSYLPERSAVYLAALAGVNFFIYVPVGLRTQQLARAVVTPGENAVPVPAARTRCPLCFLHFLYLVLFRYTLLHSTELVRTEP